MLLSKQLQVAIVQIGRLNSVEAVNALGVANGCQHSFDFGDLHQIKFNTRPYLLPNGGFDFDLAAPKFLKKADLTEPVFLLTSDPYGDDCDGDKPDCFYFCGVESEPQISIISTYLWNGLTGKRMLQDYILFMLGTAMLCALTGLRFHSERMGCVLDYCDQPLDIDLAFQSGQLCQACQSAVMRAVKANRISLTQYASSMKLINRACGKRECFVVMPFRDELNSVYEKAVYCPHSKRMATT